MTLREFLVVGFDKDWSIQSQEVKARYCPFLLIGTE
jgi:hypothetical protein